MLSGEVVDAHDLNRFFYVSEIGPGEFVARWPGGEDSGAWISEGKKCFGALMQADVIAVGEIVFERKAIGRVDEERGDECQGDDRDDGFPCRKASPDGGDRDQNDERGDGKHVAGENGAPNDGERDEEDEEDREKT